MLIGIRFSDLSPRSRWLLVVACLMFAAALGLYFFAPVPVVRLLRAWMLAVIALGAYWLSFLVDFRGRLGRMQMIAASLLALLPWVLVLVIVLGYPQLLVALLPHGG